jgi:hypothetical protein
VPDGYESNDVGRTVQRRVITDRYRKTPAVEVRDHPPSLEYRYRRHPVTRVYLMTLMRVLCNKPVNETSF